VLAWLPTISQDHSGFNWLLKILLKLVVVCWDRACHESGLTCRYLQFHLWETCGFFGSASPGPSRVQVLTDPGQPQAKKDKRPAGF